MKERSLDSDRNTSGLRAPLRFGLAAAAVASAISFGSATAAVAAPSSSLAPPPGCTGGWNTSQANSHNRAPGTAGGCTTAEAHAH
jgi:Spy/CpxP family protein refolding chaperone